MVALLHPNQNRRSPLRKRELSVSGQKKSGSGYKYVTSFIDNRGKRRWRYHRRGYPSKYLPAPNTPEFIEAYAEALKSAPKGYSRSEDSLDAAIDRYYTTKAYEAHSDSTKSNYRRRLTKIGRAYGEYSIKTLRRENLVAILEACPSTSDRNRTLSLFKIVLQESMEQGFIDSNVANTIPRAKDKPKSYETWTREDIERYLEHHSENHMARLALLLLYYTGQRGSDVWDMSDDCYKDGRIYVTQQKTGGKVDLPVHPALEAKIPHGSGIWLRSSRGTPFGSVKSFQKWFVDMAKQAGIHGKSAHGLRRAIATHLAEAGASAPEIAAITGHKTLTEVTRYISDAQGSTLADAAFDKLKGV